MSISIIKQPETAQTNLLGHPIEFELRTDNHLEEEGEKAIIYYDIQTANLFPQSGKILCVNFLQYELKFYCYTNPQPDQFQLSKMATQTLTAAQAWVNHAVPVMNSHPIIFKYWEVTGNAYEVGGVPWVRFTFEAKEKNSGMFLKQPAVTAYNFVASLYTHAEGKTPSLKSNFAVNVLVEDHNHEVIAETPYKPDQYGKVKFDLAEMLSEKIEREIKITQSPYGVDSSAVRFFNIKYSERWGVNDASPMLSSPTYYFMHGDVGHLLQGVYNDQDWSWYEELEQDQKYLSSRAVVSSAKKDQYLLFGFFTRQTLNELVLKATVKTSEHQYIELNLGTWHALSQHYININALLSDYIDNDEDVKYIYFKIEGTDMPQYKINFLDDWSEGTEFIYKNKWGWYDSVVAKGFEQKSNTYSKGKEIQHYKKSDYKSRERNISHDKPISRRAATANTGLIGRSEMLMFDELFASEQCFVVKNGIKTPISIEHSAIKTINELKDMQDVKFKYNYAFKDHIPSNLNHLIHI